MQIIQKTEKNLGSGRGCLRGSAGVEGVAEGQISYIYIRYTTEGLGWVGLGDVGIWVG